MKLTDIKLKKFSLMLLLVIFVPLASALSFSLDSPANVSKDKEFSVTLKTDEQVSENYDVKIFVYKHTKEYSEISDGTSWKSPFNYLKSAFPSKKEFKIISHFVGETEICSRLRLSSDSKNVSEVCNNIIVENSQADEQDNETNNEKNSTDEEDNNEDEPEKETNKTEKTTYNNLSAENSPQLKIQKNDSKNKNQKIILNPMEIANTSENEKVISTKQEKIRSGIIYGFTFFCVVVIIFLALRKL